MKKIIVTPKPPPDLALQVQTVPLDCGCSGCASLAAAYGSDPQLHLTVRRRLLQRGWAGTATAEEKAYQRAHATWAQMRPPEGAKFERFAGVQPALGLEDEESDMDALEEAS